MKQNVRLVMFSKELKEGTSKSHSAAENTKFVSSFLRGVVSEENYRGLIANFYFVYRAMEEEISKHKSDPTIGQVYYKSLERTNFLERDLRYFYGPNWRSIVVPTEACQQYVNRIREVEPYLLIAHHYTRYIGDLSGGVILRGIAEKALTLPKGEGLHFYDFPDISDAKGFKTSYRTQLDSIPLTEQQKNAIIVEANYAFRLNMYMFDELEGNATKSLWKMFVNFIMPSR
jgi:heme oxygenase